MTVKSGVLNLEYVRKVHAIISVRMDHKKMSEKIISLRIPNTYEAKIAKIRRLLAIVPCNSANKPSFQSPEKSLSIDVKNAATF